MCNSLFTRRSKRKNAETLWRLTKQILPPNRMPRMKQPIVHARNSYAEIELRLADNTCEGAGVAQKTDGEKKRTKEVAEGTQRQE